jgi:hypothetical protein
MKYAIDVSGYDSRRYVWNKGYVYDVPVNWQRARDDGGLSLAIIKSSEGFAVDRAFRMNWQGAAGILPRAAYHFFRSNVDALKQAQYFCDLMSSVGFNPASDFAILDFETLDGRTGQDAIRAAGVWLREVEKCTGARPMIYTYPAFWRGAGGCGTLGVPFAKYPLALAQWPLDRWILDAFPATPLFNGERLAAFKARIEAGNLRPVTLPPWTSPAIWQFTARVDSRSVPGHPAIKKAVDYVVYMDLT